MRVYCNKSNILLYQYDACSHIHTHIVCIFRTVSFHNCSTAMVITFKIVSSLSLHYNLFWNKIHIQDWKQLAFIFVVNGTPRNFLKAVSIIIEKR
jgi:hypothetical protein